MDEEPSVEPNAVRVRAPARLHFGFLDLNGGLGRRFGSLGLALDAPMLDVKVARTRAASVDASDRVARIVRAASAELKAPDDVSVEIAAEIPPHAGFGSGTQLSLAVAAGLARLSGRRFRPERIATALDRGNRSGVGLAAFMEGGFILDGGRDAGERPPPVIARHPFPPDWRVLLALDLRTTGVHGAAEASAFQAMPPFPEALASHLCRVALMQVLPALALCDFLPFSAGIAEIQARVGDHFAPFQGGGRYTSAAVGAVLERLRAAGFTGIGQSSWGPTGFALCPDPDAAAAARCIAQSVAPSLEFRVVRGRNRGAEITDVVAEAAR